MVSSATKEKHGDKKGFAGVCHMPALFRAFTTDLHDGTKRKLTKFAGSMKVGRTAGTFRRQD